MSNILFLKMKSVLFYDILVCHKFRSTYSGQEEKVNFRYARGAPII